MKIQLKRSSILENGVAKEPTAGQMEYGELAVNYNENDISIFTKDSDNNIRRVGGSVNKGSGEPGDPGSTPGDWYFDITNSILYYWDGSKWEEVQAVSKLIGGDGIEITTATSGTTFTVDLAGGDDGLEFVGGQLKATIASSSEYGVVKIGNGLDGGSDGIIKARNTISVGETPPSTNLNQGDLWWNSNEDNGRLYLYYEDANTQQWIDASPQGGNLEQEQADELYISKKNDDTAAGNINFTKNIYVGQALGIGTTAPDAALRVSLNATDTTTYFWGGGTRGLRINDETISNEGDHTKFFKSSASGTYSFNNLNGELIRINAAGNLGIGTDNPKTKVHLQQSSDAGADGIRLANKLNTGGFTQWIDGSDRFNVGFTVSSADYPTTSNITVTSEGKVGVGSLNPIASLDVVADTGPSPQVSVRSGVSGKDGILAFPLSGASKGSIITNKELTFHTSTTSNDTNERVRITTEGNVGIGTDSPDANLDIKGVSGTNPGDNAYLQFTGANPLFAFRSSNGSNSLSLDRNWASAWNEVLSINRSDGYIGIGTNSPEGLVHARTNGCRIIAESTSNSPGKFIANSNRLPNAINGQLIGQWNGNEVTRIDLRNGVDDINKTDGAIAFSTANGGQAVERIRITSNGYLGIGTSEPNAAVEIYGTTAQNSRLRVTRDDAYGEVGVINTDTFISAGGTNSNNGSLLFYAGGGERARFDTSGNFLIGTDATYPVATGSNVQVVIERHVSAFVARRSDSVGAIIALAKSRSNDDTTTLVAAGDALGEIRFSGADGTDLASQGGRITCLVDGTPGVDDMPGRLVFSTTPLGASTPVERMRITKDGRVGIGASPGNGEAIRLKGEVNQTTSYGILTVTDILPKDDGTKVAYRSFYSRPLKMQR